MYSATDCTKIVITFYITSFKIWGYFLKWRTRNFYHAFLELYLLFGFSDLFCSLIYYIWFFTSSCKVCSLFNVLIQTYKKISLNWHDFWALLYDFYFLSFVSILAFPLVAKHVYWRFQFAVHFFNNSYLYLR